MLALFLRIIILEQSLWLDESIGAWAVKNFSYRGIVNDFLRFDNHPPLYYLVLKFWTSLFGYSEFSLRMPSIFFGIGTIFFTYKIAKQISLHPWVGTRIDKKVKYYTLSVQKHQPLFVALFLTTSPLHVYYSQEARMYSMAAFFATTAIYFFIKTYSKNNITNWIGFSVSLLGLMFSDYMPVFLLPVFAIIALIKIRDKKWLTFFLVSLIPLLILGVLWIPTFMAQSEKGKWLLETLPAWRELAGGASLKQAVLVPMKFVLGRISFEPKWLYYLLVSLGSIPFLVSFTNLFGRHKQFNIKTITVSLWLLFPLIIGFAASFVFPAFSYFRFIYILPAFYLLATLGISMINNIKKQRILIIAIFITNFTGLGIYYLDSDQHREDWRRATSFIDETSHENDVVLFSYPEPFTPYTWYSQSKEISFGATNSISADPLVSREITLELIDGKERVFYFDYLKDLSDPQNIVLSTIEENGFKEVRVVNFRGVGQVRKWTR